MDDRFDSEAQTITQIDNDDNDYEEQNVEVKGMQSKETIIFVNFTLREENFAGKSSHIFRVLHLSQVHSMKSPTT